MDIRGYEPVDWPAVEAVLTGAFADDGVVAHLTLALLSGPVRTALVAADDEIAGFAALSRGWVDAPDRLVEVEILSPVGVPPARQGQGVGSALVRKALEVASAPLVFLEGDPGYYARFGFARASALGFTAPSVRIPDEAFQVWRGRAASPDLSGALVYPDEFWAHDCVGLRPGA